MRQGTRVLLLGGALERAVLEGVEAQLLGQSLSVLGGVPARLGAALRHHPVGPARTELEQHDDHARLTIDTPDGPVEMLADWVIACDGAGSGLRGMVGRSSAHAP